MREKPVLLCDADDTIIGCMHEGKLVGTSTVYHHVVERFGDVMEELGFDRTEALTLRGSIDAERCVRIGFSDLGRFPGSFALTYRKLCKLHGKTVRRAIIHRVKAMGVSVFNFEAKPLGGALEALDALRKQFRIVIVTKGNTEHQRRKVIEARCHLHAERIIVMKHKDPKEWRQRVFHPLGLSNEVLRRRSWVIGDSIRSDINPCLSFGINAVHVNVNKWSFESAEYSDRPQHTALHIVSEVREALEYIMCR